MKKFIFFIPALVLFSYSSIAQSSKKKSTKQTETVAEDVVVTGTEYIPVEGKNANGVPAALQGVWVLQSGVKPTSNAAAEEDFKNKKVAPGTEIRRDSVTRTETVNGLTQTTTEVEIERIATPIKQITPGQSNKMHIPAKPSISFFGQNETFSGFTGCNKYSGRYTLNENKITLMPAAPATKMVCIGEYDEKAFLDALRQVTTFRSNNGNLEFLNGDDVVLTFSRK